MIPLKSERELAIMKDAGSIVAIVLSELRRYIKPGVKTLLLDKKAEDIVIMNMRKSSMLCDYFVIASAESARRVKTISEAIVEGLHKLGVRLAHIEGKKEALWVLLDYSDVVVHVFYAKTREFYNLERLWQDVPKEHISSTWRHLLSKKNYPT